MNILPKKRWHVRTKENIARVRKDEAEAALKEKEEQLRIENADREARLNLLKSKSKEKLLLSCHKANDEETTHTEHINLFSDLEHSVNSSNKDHDKEIKEKKEEYEKKIGYLTYLGQDTNEALNKKNWYEVHPNESRFTRSDNVKDTYDKLVLKDADGKPRTTEKDIKNGEIGWKTKQRLDPYNTFKKYCHNQKSTVKEVKRKVESTSSSGKLKKKDKKAKNKDEKEKKLDKLRIARLKRESQEKLKTERFLTGLHSPNKQEEKSQPSKVTPKYNSQFNPELARQNYR